MKRILVMLLILFSVSLISCSEITSNEDITYDILMPVDFNSEVEVSFTFEEFHMASYDEESTIQNISVSDTFEVSQVRILTSEFGTVPYEFEFLDVPERFSAVMRDIFDKVNREEVYNNQILNILYGASSQYTVYLTTDEAEIICDFYYYEEAEELVLGVYYYQNDALLSYYNFFDIFTEEYQDFVDLL